MAVTFTTNIGLAKPTEAELAEEWVNNTQLASDNNVIITSKVDIPVQAFASSGFIIGPTTNPNIGAGQILSEFTEVQGYITGSFNIQFTAPGIGVGTGVGGYGFRLPTLVDIAFHTVGTALNQAPGSISCIGEGYFSDSSSVAGSGTVALDVIRIAGVDYARMITEAYAGKTVEWVGPNIPVAVADLDQLSGSYFYKKA